MRRRKSFRILPRRPIGIVGLETALSLTLVLVEEGVLTLESAVAKLTKAPARAFSLNAGTLASGVDADS